MCSHDGTHGIDRDIHSMNKNDEKWERDAWTESAKPWITTKLTDGTVGMVPLQTPFLRRHSGSHPEPESESSP